MYSTKIILATLYYVWWTLKNDRLKVVLDDFLAQTQNVGPVIVEPYRKLCWHIYTRTYITS